MIWKLFCWLFLFFIYVRLKVENPEAEIHKNRNKTWECFSYLVCYLSSKCHPCTCRRGKNRDFSSLGNFITISPLSVFLSVLLCVCVWHPAVNTTNPCIVTPTDGGCQAPERRICPVQRRLWGLRDHLVWMPVSHSVFTGDCFCLPLSCIFRGPCLPCPYVHFLTTCLSVCDECTSGQPVPKGLADKMEEPDKRVILHFQEETVNPQCTVPWWIHTWKKMLSIQLMSEQV